VAASIFSQFKLDGQSALVVGGNRGLGLEIAKALAEAGASIVIASRDAMRNDQAKSEIAQQYGVACATVTCDVADHSQVQAAVAEAVKKMGMIDILINSAGINIRGAIEDVSPEDFEKVQRVNVTGTWLMCREVVPVMKRKGYGRIVNISSMIGLVAIPDRTPYCTSKGAVLQMTRALAIELARTKITANAICPGPFATEMNVSLTNDPEKYQAFINRIPMGRWGELHEIGGLALYLASPASSYVTGAGFTIDGGWVAQ
jgi:NAD(P)-dependent dehydrogenase (short-subunit alcohol dehydrogenase family)